MFETIKSSFGAALTQSGRICQGEQPGLQGVRPDTKEIPDKQVCREWRDDRSVRPHGIVKGEKDDKHAGLKDPEYIRRRAASITGRRTRRRIHLKSPERRH